jgi:hypothetical protein
LSSQRIDAQPRRNGPSDVRLRAPFWNELAPNSSNLELDARDHSREWRTAEHLIRARLSALVFFERREEVQLEGKNLNPLAGF